ncbi:unnamed protein product [Closterium sp. Naga37s-1]|nr:unnamed protein product [Closterium sp. Naga37s-1]
MRETETVSNNKRPLELTEGAPTALNNPLSEPTRAGQVANSPFLADVYKALLSGEGDEEEEERRGQAGEGEGNWEGKGEGEGEWVGGGEREGEGEEVGGKNVLCVRDRNTSISRLPAISFHGVPRRPLYKHVASAFFHYCHAGGLPSAMLTCQGMEEKEGRRGEEVGRWHGTVMDAGGRLLELIEELCNEHNSAEGPWNEINDYAKIDQMGKLGERRVRESRVEERTEGEQKEGERKEEEQTEGERKEGNMVEQRRGERRTHQLHVQAEFLKQLAEGAKKVEGRCNLPPYSSHTPPSPTGSHLNGSSVQSYPSFAHRLAFEGLCVYPSCAALSSPSLLTPCHTCLPPFLPSPCSHTPPSPTGSHLKGSSVQSYPSFAHRLAFEGLCVYPSCAALSSPSLLTPALCLSIMCRPLLSLPPNPVSHLPATIPSQSVQSYPSFAHRLAFEGLCVYPSCAALSSPSLLTPCHTCLPPFLPSPCSHTPPSPTGSHLKGSSVQPYPSFPSMLASEGLSTVLPGVETLEEGLAVYRRFYSEEKEHRAGVLALRVELCGSADGDGCQADVARSQADVARRQADVKSQLESQVASLIHRILVAMGSRGMSRLVGMRVTEGSVLAAFPPSRAALIASFQQPVKGGVKARKEKKQRQREQRQTVQRHEEVAKEQVQRRQGKGEQEQQDEQEQQEQEEQQEKQQQQQQQWQQQQQQKQEQQQEFQQQQEQQQQLSRFIECAAESAMCCSCQVESEACLTSLLDGATWMNVHALPHDLPVFEVRGSEGYGARWSADGSQGMGRDEVRMALSCRAVSRTWRALFSSPLLFAARRIEGRQEQLLALFHGDPSVSGGWLLHQSQRYTCPTSSQSQVTGPSPSSNQSRSATWRRRRIPPMTPTLNTYGLSGFGLAAADTCLFLIGGTVFDATAYPSDRPVPTRGSCREECSSGSENNAMLVVVGGFGSEPDWQVPAGVVGAAAPVRPIRAFLPSARAWVPNPSDSSNSSYPSDSSNPSNAAMLNPNLAAASGEQDLRLSSAAGEYGLTLAAAEAMSGVCLPLERRSAGPVAVLHGQLYMLSAGFLALNSELFVVPTTHFLFGCGRSRRLPPQQHAYCPVTNTWRTERVIPELQGCFSVLGWMDGEGGNKEQEEEEGVLQVGSWGRLCLQEEEEGGQGLGGAGGGGGGAAGRELGTAVIMCMCLQEEEEGGQGLGAGGGGGGAAGREMGTAVVMCM